MRMPVAVEESFQPKNVAMVRAADDHRSADVAFEKTDAAQDERAHDALPQLGFRHQDVTQLVRRNDQSLDWPRRVRVHQRRAARELGELAHERARAVRDDRLVAPELVVLGDRDLAGQDDEHARTDFTGRYQTFARPVGPRLAEAPQAVDLRGLQGGKHLLISGLDDRTRRCSHGRWTIRLFYQSCSKPIVPSPHRAFGGIRALARAAGRSMLARIVVVGAGPTGTALSYLLARRGIDVVLLERETDFDRLFRGEGMMPCGIDALAQMGLRQHLEWLPSRRLDRWEFYFDGVPFLVQPEPDRERPNC